MIARLLFLLIALAWPIPAHATEGQKMSFPLRARTLTLTLYRPAGVSKGTIVMGSGDAGWVGLAVSMSEYLSDQGYLVVGLNVRQYLASFTAGPQHLSATDPARDYRALSEFLAHQGLLRPPVFLSGVSEGAALAILAAADQLNHRWIDGVVAMGVPATAELAWRWKDVMSWVTKSDLDEPSFAPHEYIGAVSPVPLVLIQSATDEYLSELERTRLFETAQHPKKLVLIGARNHRFTDKLGNLRAEFIAAIPWTQIDR